jgi:hypothetical protein
VVVAGSDAFLMEKKERKEKEKRRKCEDEEFAR